MGHEYLIFHPRGGRQTAYPSWFAVKDWYFKEGLNKSCILIAREKKEKLVCVGFFLSLNIHYIV